MVRHIILLNRFILGWGKYEPNGPFTPTLQRIVVPVTPIKICQKQNNQLYRYVKVYPHMHLCVGYNETGGNQYACTGDSGGGFFQKRFNRWFVQGVVSWVDPTCNASLHNTYTVTINLAHYARWLGSNMDLKFLEI